MRFLVVLSVLLYSCVALPAVSDTNRIVGGYDAKEGSAPYMASLKDDVRDHFCGGSILNKRWVLTAAHCVYPNNHLEYIYVGSNSLARGGSYYNVEEVIVHDLYNGPSNLFLADIALVKVDRDIEFNEAVQPIKLRRRKLSGGARCKLTGWGLTRMDDEELPEKLQELRVNALDDLFCEMRTGVKVNGQLCALKRIYHGACSGDSGGPLTFNGEQVGLVSFTLGNCADGKPDFYTRISSYVDWIDEHAKI